MSNADNMQARTQEQELELLRLLILGTDSGGRTPHDSVADGISGILKAGSAVLGGLFGGMVAASALTGAVGGMDDLKKQLPPNVQTIVVVYKATIDRDEPGYWEGRFSFVIGGKRVDEITVETVDAEGNPLLDGTLYFHGKNLPVKYGKSTIRRSELVKELKSKKTMERVRYITAGGLEVPGNVHVDWE